MATTKNFPQISGMTLVISTLVLFVTNVAVLFIAQSLFPKAIVLGTHALSYWWAVGMSMSKLAVIGAIVMPFVSKYEAARQRIFSPIEWSVLYLVVNVATLWVISRFSEQFGLGVSSWMVIVGLAVVLDVAQGMVMMVYGKMLS
ncbi:MAG: hypothetical protein ABI425_02410 [Patescibacteria group bacterium]